MTTLKHRKDILITKIIFKCEGDMNDFFWWNMIDVGMNIRSQMPSIRTIIALIQIFKMYIMSFTSHGSIKFMNSDTKTNLLMQEVRALSPTMQ